MQNEATVLTLQQKMELVAKLVAAAPASIEVASFVRADLVPAMAHARELCLALNDAPWAVAAKATGKLAKKLQMANVTPLLDRLYGVLDNQESTSVERAGAA